MSAQRFRKKPVVIEAIRVERPCPCGCGWTIVYTDSNYWYFRGRFRWFWRLAYKVVCPICGCKKNCAYGDCYRCA